MSKPHSAPFAAGDMSIREGGPAAAYLTEHPVTSGPPGEAGAAVARGFGIDADGQACLGEGWSKPEAGYIWSDANVATLHLPRPVGAGTWRLRLVLRPFVMPPAVPAQLLTLEVNASPLGSVRMEHFCVLECDLPWPLLAAAEQVTLRLGLPDATRPMEVGASRDGRALGVRLIAASLSRIAAEPPPAESAPMVETLVIPAPAGIQASRTEFRAGLDSRLRGSDDDVVDDAGQSPRTDTEAPAPIAPVTEPAATVTPIVEAAPTEPFRPAAQRPRQRPWWTRILPWPPPR